MTSPSPSAPPPGLRPAEVPPRRVLVDLAPRSVVFALAVIVVVVVAYWLLRAVPAVVIRTTVGVFLALALNPVVDAAMRRLRLGRPAAIAVVGVGFLAVASAFALLAVPRAVDQLANLRSQVPAVISDLDHLPAVGHAIAQSGIGQRVGESLDHLPEILAANGKSLQGLVQSAGDGLVTVFWVLLVAVTALLDGPRLARDLLDLFPSRLHDEVEHLGNLAYQVIGRYAAGTGFVALVNGAAVTSIGLVLGTPLAPVVGVWSALWNVVPQIGGLMGGGTLVALSLTRGASTGLVALACFLVYQQIENNVLQPVIIGKTVNISPLANMTAVLAGAAVGGFVGALIANPILAILKAIYREQRRRRGEPAMAATAGEPA